MYARWFNLDLDRKMEPANAYGVRALPDNAASQSLVEGLSR
jgi:hypothetical protein